MKKKMKVALLALICVLALLCGAMGIYLCSYSHASFDAASLAENAGTALEIEGRQVLLFGPKDAKTAVIFYPGGKVQAEAYAPLCSALGEQGYLVALVKMPFRLAVFDMGAAGSVTEYLKTAYDTEEIYLCGHSLGGAMASAFAAEHADSFKGIIWLGAYSASDLSGTSLRILSLYGSEDRVLNREKYLACKGSIPADFTEIVIDGGCHAYFGDYGAQKGDGNPTISRDAQLNKTLEAICAWLSNED